MTKFSVPHHPDLERYLMYAGLWTFDTLHKTICCIRAGLRILLEVTFREFYKGEVRRIPILGSWVNKGMKKGRGARSRPNDRNPAATLEGVSTKD